VNPPFSLWDHLEGGQILVKLFGQILRWQAAEVGTQGIAHFSRNPTAILTLDAMCEVVPAQDRRNAMPHKLWISQLLSEHWHWGAPKPVGPMVNLVFGVVKLSK